MAPRVSLPGELFLDAIVIYPERQLDVGYEDNNEFGRRIPFDEATRERVKRREPCVALRWVLNPALGIPLEPFTVWRRPVSRREVAQPIDGWHQVGFYTFEWDGVTEMLRVEVDLTAPATITGLHRNDIDLEPVQTVSGNAGDTVVLDAGPMLGVRTNDPAAIGAARGQSLVMLANGAGWRPIEIVGLPFAADQLNATYYDGAQQGPVGALTDPFDAAVGRLERWGPVLGWLPLAGLDPWAPPDAKPLVEEVQSDLLPDLVQVMASSPPPAVDAQVRAAIVHNLAQLRQVIGARSKALNTGAAADRAQITVRPLQALTMSVATDTWASLALGFGTGDLLYANDREAQGGNDYMVTAPWDGILKTAVQQPWPFPWLPSPPPLIIEEEVKRELAAIVLSPSVRPAPGAPVPLTAGLGHDEGADSVDEPYHASVVLQTTRLPSLPRQPRAAAYALARYDDPGTGAYQLRKHRLAGGWVPIGSAAPVPDPGTPPDPHTPPNTATLRNSGVARPITGPAHTYQYYAASADLFGQWSPWATTWYALDAAGVQAPAVANVKAHAVGTADPCALTVATEVVWDIRERSLHELTLAIDAYTPTPPPAAYDPPPDAPQGGTVTTLTLSFAADGTPDPPPAGVDIELVHDDDTPVDAAHPADPTERRYRITVHDLPVTFAGRSELAVAVYAEAEETIRPGEWSGWAHTREAAIAANPIPPPPPVPLPAVYPYWASLPDGAGLSYATVNWTPSGAWRYRVYEATEAALRAACGEPGPVLTDGLAERMQALFDLYQVADNLPKLKKAFRKLGTEPVLPPLVDGKMHFQAFLPRGSSLIHCYVVAGVTESNVISSWPQPDAGGRKAFDGYVIPHVRRLSLPQLRAGLDDTGVPQVTVLLEGAVPATEIRLYRAANAILARSTGTMQLVAGVPPGTTAPDFWKRTTIPDPAAPVGWSRLQYRAVAVISDDLERAGMAVASEASRSYALLNPPPNPPALALTANVRGTTATVSLVRVDTDALRAGSDVGDFAIAYTLSALGIAPIRNPAVALGTVPEYATADDLAASADTAGYLGGVLYLRLQRAAGQELDLTVDISDPLGRATHGVLGVPAVVPDPAPVVALAAARFFGIARLRIDTNVPLPPDPAHDWTLTVGTQRLFNFPPLPPLTRSFSVSSLATIPNEAAMPNPAFDPAPYEIRRVDGTSHIVMWFRAPVGIRVGVRLTNAEGQSDTATQLLP